MAPEWELTPVSIPRAELVSLLLDVVEGVREGRLTEVTVHLHTGRGGHWLAAITMAHRERGPIIVGEYEAPPPRR